MSSIEILGCRVDAVGADEAVERVVELAGGTHPALVVTLGTEMVMEAQRNEPFRRVLGGAALSLCDTIGLLLASRLRRGPLRERVTGVELVERLAERSRAAGIALYLLGGRPGVAEQAAQTLLARYPGARIAGWRDGYFSAEETTEVLAAIARSGAQVLCAGLGSPKQELWLEEHLAASGARVGIGVGGTFDVLSGNVVRAPVGWRTLGMEWLHRLIREPWRWRRQLVLPRFALAVLAETLDAARRRRQLTI